ncbi:MAG: hypothetical protein ACK2TV_13955 [Anaerolineales bacterium]
MLIRIGIENNIEGRTLAWVLDYPGCFAYGQDESEALVRLPPALIRYDMWIKDHTSSPWLDFSTLDIRVVERFETFNLNGDYHQVPDGQGYEINAWFIDDWRPLTSLEIEHALTVFHWQREELLAGLSTLDPQVLEKDHPGQRWNIWGIVKHIANAELWYLQRLGLTNINRKGLLPDPIERLSQTANMIDSVFPSFMGIVNVLGKDGEFWSYRKIVRRTLWHQRDHIEHIKALAFSED